MNRKNSEIEYQYVKYLCETKARKEGTIRKVEAVFKLWNKIQNKRLYSKSLTESVIYKFKTSLREGTYHGKDKSPGSIYTDLIILKNFFQWLGSQPGYRRLIKPDILEYFNPSVEEKTCKYGPNIADYPTMEQIIELCQSVKIKTVVDLRNQAIIALLAISAIRVDCLASLKVGSYNPAKKCLDLDPRKGVRTKYSKSFRTYLFQYTPELQKVVDDWHRLLVDSSYKANDPLFPKARQETDGCSFVEATVLSKEHLSAGRIREIVKILCHKAGLPYYSPHKFRHSCVGKAMEIAEDAEDIKAISQNIGHENITLIMGTYALLPDKVLGRLIQNMSASSQRKLAKITI